MIAALGDFYINGVETSIPLYKTILKTPEFCNGDLSTDFLKRYDILKRLEMDLSTDRLDRTEAALAAAAMHPEFLNGTTKPSERSNSIMWKARL